MLLAVLAQQRSVRKRIYVSDTCMHVRAALLFISFYGPRDCFAPSSATVGTDLRSSFFRCNLKACIDFYPRKVYPCGCTYTPDNLGVDGPHRDVHTLQTIWVYIREYCFALTRRSRRSSSA